MRRRIPRWALGCLLWALTGCPRPGTFVWVDSYLGPKPSKEYVIVPGDTLNVRVFQQENMSARVKVRADGKVSLPFLNDVLAAGFTPMVLAAQLLLRLKDFINNPVVTISLEELKPLQVSVIGEVPRPGIYSLEPGSGVLQALATAGGFTEFAHKDMLFVLRQTPGATPTRIRFTYEALSRAQGAAPTFTLLLNDVVVVE